MRSAAGARAYARLKSVHETANRKGQNFLQILAGALVRALSPRSWDGVSTG